MEVEISGLTQLLPVEKPAVRGKTRWTGQSRDRGRTRGVKFCAEFCQNIPAYWEWPAREQRFWEFRAKGVYNQEIFLAWEKCGSVNFTMEPGKRGQPPGHWLKLTLLRRQLDANSPEIWNGKNWRMKMKLEAWAELSRNEMGSRFFDHFFRESFSKASENSTRMTRLPQSYRRLRVKWSLKTTKTKFLKVTFRSHRK